jgi:hypothetical protein
MANCSRNSRRTLSFPECKRRRSHESSCSQARQGCGPGSHRAPNGMCRPNRGQQQAYVVGRFYAGHGYWYNNRWYQRRVRWQNGWRYR